VIRPGRVPILTAAGLALVTGLALRSPASERLQAVVTPSPARPGDVLLVRVPGAPPDVAVTLGARGLRLFGVQGGMAALVGLDLDTQPGALGWRVTRAGAGGEVEIGAGSLEVRAVTFPTQSLTLPPAQVELDAKTLARVRVEQAELRQALESGAAERLWDGAFQAPVDDGRPTGGFGLRRLINGQPRSPHTGFDWAAPRGTPVHAANTGRVTLVAEHFFAGRLVVLDHGLGLFTLYFHLDESHVTRGERVVTGQRLGRVGATGRTTGPHLHLGVVLDGARVDPMSLLQLPLGRDTLRAAP
jgi:murein DD-endopeptidase MepM/ murein hydrolase activator NlpD